MITTIKANDKNFTISLEGKTLQALYVTPTGGRFLCSVGLEADNKVFIKGSGIALRVRLSDEKYNLLMQAVSSANTVKEVVEFTSHHDLETGITWFTLKNRISRQAWTRIAHLFQRDVELDCPEGRAWNDSITLAWATRQPETVKIISGCEPSHEEADTALRRLEE